MRGLARASRVALVLGAALTLPGAPSGAAGSGRSLDPWVLWAGPTLLRGANIYQRRVYPELDGSEFMGPGPFGPPYTQADFDALAATGANLVDLSVAGIFSEDPPYALDVEAQADLDRLLGMAEAAGLYAVISFRTGPGRSDFSVCCLGEDWYDPGIYQDDSVWERAAAQDAWVAMWRAAAERYRDHPAVVAYDLMVEPNSNEVLYDEWDPEVFFAAHGGSLADWNQLYPRIITAIREVDADTPILVQPNAYGAVEWLPWMQVVDDPRTIYAVHQYEPYVYTHQDPPLQIGYPGVFDGDGDGEPETVDRDWLDGLLGTVDAFMADHGVRVAVNEMGVKRWEPGAARFLTDEIGLLEARGLNWAVWAWEPSWEPWASSVTDFNFRFGTDPDSRQDVPGNPVETALLDAFEADVAGPAEASGQELVIPAAGNLPGLAGTRWRSSLEIKAAGGSPVTVSVALIERDRSNSAPRTAVVTVPAGRAVRWGNVLEDLFAFEGAAALRVIPLDGTVLGVSRTFTSRPEGGTYGELVPGQSPAEAAPAGKRCELIHLSGPPDFRTNLGLVHPGQGTVTVEIELYRANGEPVDTRSVTLGPWEYRQLTAVLESAGTGDVADAFAVVTSSGGSVLAHASVVDNRTGDAVFLPARLTPDTAPPD